MVDPLVLASDVVSGIGGFLLTPILWIALFVWAWSRPVPAQASGFGRMTFWLLLPGAFLGSLADAPFFPWAGDVLAINVGGALIPVALSVVLLYRGFGTTGGPLTRLVLLWLAVETAAQLASVLLLRPIWTDAVVPIVAGAVTGVAAATWPAGALRPGRGRGLTFLFLTSTAIVITFLTSEAVPGSGIESQFPFYLIGPVLVGVASAWFATGVWGAPAYTGLGVGYASATLGTLIGADVLREPPLYAGGGGALFAIGGAGVQDLVYFSGLLAVGAGLLFTLIWRRLTGTAWPDGPDLPPTPGESLRSAATRFGRGDGAGATQDAIQASFRAALRVREIFHLPAPADPSSAWDGLPVAPYVANDYRNLLASREVPTPSPQESWRNIAMGAQFVRLGRDLSRLRFASASRRGWAAVIDLLLVSAPAVGLWTLLALTQPGGATAILVGLPFNLAVFGFVAYALLYFVVGDAVFGTTVGKMLFHLRVTDRRLARPTILQSFLRNAPKVVSVYVIGEFGGPGLLLVLGSGGSTLNPGGVLLAFTGAVLLTLTVLIVALALAVGGIQVARDPERQRLGDRWASTWVVDRRSFSPAWGATRSPSAAPPGAAPPA